MFKGRTALVYYNGSDKSWLPNQDDQFIYGLFRIDNTDNIKSIMALSWNGAKMATKVYGNAVWNDWMLWTSKSDIPNWHYIIRSSVINKPIEAIKEQWDTMPDGYYLCDIRAGAAYISIVQRINSGKYGSVIIHGYTEGLPIFLRYVNGVWGVIPQI